MTIKAMTVLGISLGSRQTGLAVLDGKELLIYQIVTINAGTNSHYKLLAHYITQYRITSVVIKLPPEKHITVNIQNLINALDSLFRELQCRVCYINFQSFLLFSDELRNKQSIIDVTTRYYPDLKIEKEKESSNKNKYYVKLFEAVLAAHQHQLTQSSHL